jgi:hypothetical protein
LSSFDEDLLSIRLDVGNRENLNFEGFAISGGVYFNFVLLAIMLNENWDLG